MFPSQRVIANVAPIGITDVVYLNIENLIIFVLRKEHHQVCNRINMLSTCARERERERERRGEGVWREYIVHIRFQLAISFLLSCLIRT